MHFGVCQIPLSICRKQLLAVAARRFASSEEHKQTLLWVK